MDERRKKAFDFAQESTKQLPTLATGIIALTITFAKDFVGTVPVEVKWLALGAWLSFLVSVVFGAWTLLALTGTLEPAGDEVTPSIRSWNVTLPSALQVLTFLAGLAFTVAFGIKAF